MLIGRFIKPGSPLFVKIEERIRSLDRLFSINPVRLFPVWLFMAAGMSAARGVSIEEFYWATDLRWPLILVFLGMTLLACSSSLRGNDSESERPTLILFLTGILLVLPAVIWEALAAQEMTRFFAVGAWLSIFYVCWRSYLFYWPSLADDKLLMSLPLSAVSSLSLFMIGWHSAGGTLLTGLISAAPYVCGFVAIALLWPQIERAEQMYHRDVMTDVNRLFSVSTILLAISIFLGYRLGDPVVSTAAIVTIPFFGVALLFPRAEHVIRAFRYPPLILAVFVGVRYPWLWLALFVLFHGVRWYNYFRHGVVRPTLKVSYD